MELVPTVDIADPSATSVEALDRACRDHGFFLLEGHGLSELADDNYTDFGVDDIQIGRYALA